MNFQTAVSRFQRQHPNIVLHVSGSFLDAYARDEAMEVPHRQFVVLFPANTAEVSKIVSFASELSVPIVPRGAGSGLSGAAVPGTGCFVVSLERMNHILELDAANMTVRTEPGVITSEIRNRAQEAGLYYPPIPASVDFCTIGGNVATNAGGLCAVKYGVTREYVLGLELVLADGSVIRTGGKFAKCSTGYNLTQLVVGSEGTLAVVTEITLRLIPFPKARITLLAGFSDHASVANAVTRILAGPIIPPTLELLPREAVACVLRRHPETRFPLPDSVASLLIELDGKSDEEVQSFASGLEETLHGLGATEILAAPDETKREEIWTVRKLVRDSIANSGDYIEADSVVPRSKLPDLVLKAQSIAKEVQLPCISYGHAGDGNLHTYYQRGSLDEKEWLTRSKRALERLFEETLQLEGTLSGEHGIGILKKDYMRMAFPEHHLSLFQRVKAAFDPKGIMNPGKVIP